MSEKKDVKIIAFVGMSGSGKSVAVEYLTEKGYPKIYFGGMILKGVKEKGWEINEENEKRFREEIRKTEGNDWVVRQVIKETDKLIEAGQKRIVLDGLYSWTEYKELKKAFPGMLTVVAVVLPKRIRYKRVGKREIRPLNVTEVRERDAAEIENLEKGGPIAAADYFILNSKTMKEFHEDLDKVLSEIDF